MRRPPGWGEGSPPHADIGDSTDEWCNDKGEGEWAHKSENFADVICEWPPPSKCGTAEQVGDNLRLTIARAP